MKNTEHRILVLVQFYDKSPEEYWLKDTAAAVALVETSYLDLEECVAATAWDTQSGLLYDLRDDE